MADLYRSQNDPINDEFKRAAEQGLQISIELFNDEAMRARPQKAQQALGMAREFAEIAKPAEFDFGNATEAYGDWPKEA